MARHAEYWRPWVESGQMVIFGPVLDGSGSWGLGVVEADDEEELRAFAADDPVVTTGTGTIEVGKMLGGFVRPRHRTVAGTAGARRHFGCSAISLAAGLSDRADEDLFGVPFPPPPSAAHAGGDRLPGRAL